MEKLISEISASTVAIVGAIGVSIIYLIKEVFAVLSKWVSNEIQFRQKLSHDRRKLTHEIDLELQKEEQRNRILIEKNKLRTQLNKSTSADVNRVIDILDNIKNTFELQRALLVSYHNGIQRGYRNFSIRYERVRDGILPIKSDYQAKPLADYHKEIDRFSEEKCIVYNIDDKHTDENLHILAQMQMLDVTMRITIPLLVPIDNNNIPEEHKSIVVGQECDYYLVGVFIAHFDNASHFIEGKQTEIMLRNKVDDILNLYEKNPNILV